MNRIMATARRRMKVGWSIEVDISNEGKKYLN